jgi:hypothetical protein
VKYLLISVFLLLSGGYQAYAADGVACTMEAKICPDGSAVSRTGPNCEFAPCPEGNAVPEPASLTSCVKDDDCIIVPYSHCCGSTKRAINKTEQENYQAHPEWQKFDDVSKCAVMGACVTDKDVTKARCAIGEDEDTGTCELTR